MQEMVRKLGAAVRNVVTRALIDRSDPDGKFAQIETTSGRVMPEVELFEPHGVHFRAPAGAEGIAVSPQGVLDNVVVLSANDRAKLPILPPVLAEGEGGLYLLGTFKVFLKADGSVYLGDITAVSPVTLDIPNAANMAALKSWIALAAAAIAVGTPTDGGTANVALATGTTAFNAAFPVPSAATLVKAI